MWLSGAFWRVSLAALYVSGRMSRMTRRLLTVLGLAVALWMLAGLRSNLKPRDVARDLNPLNWIRCQECLRYFAMRSTDLRYGDMQRYRCKYCGHENWRYDPPRG